MNKSSKTDRAAPENAATPFRGLEFVRIPTRWLMDYDALPVGAFGVLMRVCLLKCQLGQIPIDNPRRLARLTYSDPDEFERQWKAVAPLLEQGELRDYLTGEIQRVEKCRDDGRKGAKKRWQDGDPNSDPTTDPSSDPNSQISTRYVTERYGTRDQEISSTASSGEEAPASPLRADVPSIASRKKTFRDRRTKKPTGKSRASHMELEDLDDPHAVTLWQRYPVQRRDEENESIFAGAWYEHVTQANGDAPNLGELLLRLLPRYLSLFSLSAREGLEHPSTWVGRMVTALTTFTDVDKALDEVRRQSEAFNGTSNTKPGEKPDPWAPADEEPAF